MAERILTKKPTRRLETSGAKKARWIKLVNFETRESASILPDLGAKVRELVLRCGDDLYSVLEFPPSADDTAEKSHYAGAKLIPFPGRIVDATYRFAGKKYTLKVNSGGHVAIHGFFFDKPYDINKTKVGNKSASVILTTEHDGKTKGYPFKFSVLLTYTLASGTFTCATEIRNTDSKPIPIGDGWHPYFRTSGSVKRLLLSIPAHAVVEVTPLKVPGGEMRKPVSRRTTIPLSNRTLDSVFDFGETRRKVTTKLIDRQRAVEIQMWQDSGAGRYRYLVLYRPPSGTSVAIEPWTCAPNSFNNGMGLIILKPGRKFKGSYGVRLKKLQS